MLKLFLVALPHGSDNETLIFVHICKCRLAMKAKFFPLGQFVSNHL